MFCLQPPSCGTLSVRRKIFGRETVDSASGPASPVLTGYGNSVGSLGPRLTSESADAVRAVRRAGLPAGPQVRAPTGGAGLIRPAWTRGWGSRGPAASGCVPSLNLRKGGQRSEEHTSEL